MELRFSLSHFPEKARIIAQRDVSGLSLIDASYPPKLRISNHSHEKANFCMALQGGCTERYGRKVREYNPLSLDFFPANHTHSLAFGSASLRCFSVNVAPRLLNDLREFSLFLDASVHCQGGALAWLFMRLYKEFLQRDTASQLAIEGLVLEMLAEVSRKQIGPSEQRPPGWLQHVNEILHSRFLDDLSLSELSQAAGVHPVHLSREFRRHYSSTIGEYIRQLRIRYACQKMLNHDVSLAEIASAAGFADESHFARTFKRLVGISPGAFRSTLSGR